MNGRSPARGQEFTGVIYADGGACPRAGRRPDQWAGFNELFAGNRIAEAGCWAHVRRKFFDVHAATASPIAKEALDHIGQLSTSANSTASRRRSGASRPNTGDENASSD